jgi:hypothetical protein
MRKRRKEKRASIESNPDTSNSIELELAEALARRTARNCRYSLTPNGWSRMLVSGTWSAGLPFFLYTTPIFSPQMHWAEPRDMIQCLSVAGAGGLCLALACSVVAETRARRLLSRRDKLATRRQKDSNYIKTLPDDTMIMKDSEYYAIVMINMVFLGSYIFMALFLVPKFACLSTSTAASHAVSILIPAVLLCIAAGKIWRQLMKLLN